MTTLFPIEKSKVTSFMSTLENILNAKTDLKAKQYSFNFNTGIPL